MRESRQAGVNGVASEELEPVRVIPCLDVNDGRVVKGMRFERLRDIGDPTELARRYESEGADELVFLDITASHEGRSTVIELADRAGDALSIPFTVGGGISSVDEAEAVLLAGADKVTVNSAALERPELIDEMYERFGAQCVVLAIDAKREKGEYVVYSHGGRTPAKRRVAHWASEAADRGAGEVLLTSMDRDGMTDGYDTELLRLVAEAVNRPVIASGGAGTLEHFAEAVRSGSDAVLGASVFHDGTFSIPDVKAHLADRGIPVRPCPGCPGEVRSEGMTPRVVVLDYGMGNRTSVRRALERAGAAATVTADRSEILEAEGLVLPGVGAFPATMERLNGSGLRQVIEEFRETGKPVLGICLGEQLFFDVSREHEDTRGLGWFEGEVVELELPVTPNMGWREVLLDQPSPLFKGIGEGEMFYHAHSYAALPGSRDVVVGRTRLTQPGGQADAISVVNRDNVSGVQFHPEKSGHAGLKLLRNFASMCSDS